MNTTDTIALAALLVSGLALIVAIVSYRSSIYQYKDKKGKVTVGITYNKIHVPDEFDMDGVLCIVENSSVRKRYILYAYLDVQNTNDESAKTVRLNKNAFEIPASDFYTFIIPEKYIVNKVLTNLNPPFKIAISVKLIDTQDNAYTSPKIYYTKSWLSNYLFLNEKEELPYIIE
jgi:hypothetical protein